VIIPNFVSLKKSPEDLAEEKMGGPCSIGDYPQDIYPYGTCISLCEDEIEKLNLGTDVDAGDTMFFACVGKVTSVNKRDTTDGQKMRVEIQITDIAVEEQEPEQEQLRFNPKKLYKE
jgi:hypothetical protein